MRTSETRPTSASVFANTPTVSRGGDCRRIPVRGMRPWVGLKPKTPQKDAGRMTDPLVWVPTASGAICAATAAALLRPSALVDWRPVRRRHTGGIDDVLEADRDAVKCSERAPLRAVIVEPLRLGPDNLGVDKSPRLEFAVALRDGLEKGFGHVGRLELAPLSPGAQLDGCQAGQVPPNGHRPGPASNM
jgi:hypothetical protein